MPGRIIVIGGGIGGLAGAARLARLGHDVMLFEKNRVLGGKAGRLVMDGCTFDTGPTLMTMRFVLDELMQAADVPESERPELIPVEPVCRYFFNDRDPFDASANPEIMHQNLAASFPREVNAYDRFMRYAGRIYRNTAPVFVFSPIHEPRSLLQWRHLPSLLKLHQIDPFRSVHRSVRRFFRDPALIQLFDRYPTYNGSDPYRAPATLNVIPYVELGLGGYAVRGGLYELVAALEKTAETRGVRIHRGIRVDRILHRNGRVTGVVAQDRKFDADIVLCNSDVVYAYNTLLREFSQTARKLNRLEPSLSGLVFFWRVKGVFPQLKQHNIIFSDNYQQEFKQIFHDKIPPADPTVYISISSRMDPHHAPPGHENWFVLINMPYLHADQAWTHEQTFQVRRKVIEKLKKHGLHVEPAIESERVLTPSDIAVQTLSNRGSIYGISSNSMNSAFMRPPNRSRELRGLYFAGGSTHPGGGVPMCMLSGKIAAELIHARGHR
ncbi:phytoene desaturase [bacterium]|nr:phytoene desaturase [bacterium]